MNVSGERRTHLHMINEYQGRDSGSESELSPTY